MAINTRTPVAVSSAPTADYFDLAHIDTSNRASGIVVEVWWNAWQKDGDAKTLVANCGPHEIKNGDTGFNDAHPGVSGDRLDVVAADAFARAKAYEQQGYPPALAYQGGYRDALYAELQLVGKMPEA